MDTTFVVFAARLPDAWAEDLAPDSDRDFARTNLLARIWDDLRLLDWHIDGTVRVADHVPHTRHLATLQFDGLSGDEPHLSITVTTRCGEDPIVKAKCLLDLPLSAEPRIRSTETGSLWSYGHLRRIRNNTVIGPIPRDWPIGRRITDYSHYLGSYGQGGVGLAGWQLNNGSWMILPLSNAASWMTLTLEEATWFPEVSRATVVIDQRILGVHPDLKDRFPPWEHNYAGEPIFDDLPDFSTERARITRFEASRTNFVLETGDAYRIWRFQIGDHLPRPAWPGSGRPRDFLESEYLADVLVLTHDCYLDV
ncbi:MAG: hypothetical protein QM605_07985 [Sphingobium sp.]